MRLAIPPADRASNSATTPPSSIQVPCRRNCEFCSVRVNTEVWEEENEAAIQDWMTPDVGAKGLHAEGVANPDEFAAFHRALCALVTEIRITFIKGIETGDWFAIHGRFDCKSRKTGAPASFTFHCLSQFEGERFAFAYNGIDFIALFESLGQIEEGSLEALMGGGALKRT